MGVCELYSAFCSFSSSSELCVCVCECVYVCVCVCERVCERGWRRERESVSETQTERDKESEGCELRQSDSSPSFRMCECDAHANRLHRRSEEHTSELQSHLNIVCRLLLENK